MAAMAARPMKADRQTAKTAEFLRIRHWSWSHHRIRRASTRTSSLMTGLGRSTRTFLTVWWNWATTQKSIWTWLNPMSSAKTVCSWLSICMMALSGMTASRLPRLTSSGLTIPQSLKNGQKQTTCPTLTALNARMTTQLSWTWKHRTFQSLRSWPGTAHLSCRSICMKALIRRLTHTIRIQSERVRSNLLNTKLASM